MRQIIQPNSTLLVDGPASVCLVNGKVEVFGYPIKETQHIVVRTGKRLPFYAAEAAEVEVLLGANAAIAEFEGNTIPASWNQPAQTVLNIEKKKPVVVAVLGAADSGKSSFCTYLFNKLVEADCRVAVVDGDLGQSDIGPSASVGYGMASRHITQLHNLRMRNGFFIGVTSPVSAQAKAIEAVKAMLAEVSLRGADYVLVNTDGWVSGADAASYKIALLDTLQPDLVVGVQVQGELELLRGSLTQPLMLVEASAALNPRSPEKRKILREMTYARYLKKSKLQCYPLSQIKVEPRGAVPKSQEPDKGILVGLYGYGPKFLGIGVLRAINVGRRVLKVQTAVSDKPMRLTFGKVVLNRKLQEIED